MTANTRTVAIALVAIAVITAVAILRAEAPATGQPVQISAVSYYCKGDATITAVYYQSENKPAPNPGQPPVPGGSVALVLSDGRTMTLSRTYSASGIRYANADESFVFWSKGDGALALENNEEKSYIGCIAAAPEPEGLSQVYANSDAGFSLRLPAGAVIDESYRYQELGPNKDIYGIKFTIPASIATGTNLSADSYLSVEAIPQTEECSAALFLDRAAARAVTDGGTLYSIASTTGAAAGNRYEETVYALSSTNRCIAVRYYIHYGVFENYAPGLVREFDQQALLAQFDAMRRTLRIVQ
jgi:membrane-bound inhibitor of C-type lysozyme